MKAQSQPGGHRVTATGDVLLNVTRQSVPQTDGTTSIHVTLNLGDAPAPQRRYSSDTAAVDTRGEVVRLLFGQIGAFDDSFRTLLVVRMYPEAVRRFVVSCGDMSKSLREFLAKNGQGVAVSRVPTTEPAHLVMVDANVISAGFSGREAEMDFYRIGPQAISKTARNEMAEIEVDPVVRVNCSTALLGTVLQSIEQLIPSLPSDPT